jgi:hypothetical protein
MERFRVVPVLSSGTGDGKTSQGVEKTSWRFGDIRCAKNHGVILDSSEHQSFD